MRNRLRQVFRTGALSLVAVVVLASFITRPHPADADGPAKLLSGAVVDADVLAVLDRSCRDCHSDATRYPWYSYVAPVSLLIGADVTHGREHLNLSRWQEYSKIRQQRALSEIANQVKDRGMPLQIYLWMHPSAALSNAEVERIFDWTQRERLRLITSSH